MEAEKRVVTRQHVKAESVHEAQRKGKVQTTKRVYSVCAYFHQTLNILAISLIDKEVKLYKLRQNGAKLLFMELFSFSVKQIVTCLHIEQFVVNGRAILCLGQINGDISIYYIDEPAVPTDSYTKASARRQSTDAAVKLKQAMHSHFNFFNHKPS